jgi:hypothetical protein
MRILILETICWLFLLVGMASAQGYPWCSTMDYVLAEVDGGNLVLHHKYAAYNCCPDPFTFAMTSSNDSLYVTEREVLTMPCSCLCCYNLSTTVEGLAPGEWHIVYRWLDDDPWGWRDSHLTVIIDETNQAGFPAIARSEKSGCLDPSGTAEDIQDPVFKTELLQNTPNPFNPRTTIAFATTDQASVNLQVFDLAGRLVRVLVDDETVTRGRHEVVWNGRDDTGRKVAAGVYFYRLTAGPWSEMKRMVLVK